MYNTEINNGPKGQFLKAIGLVPVPQTYKANYSKIHIHINYCVDFHNNGPEYLTCCRLLHRYFTGAKQNFIMHILKNLLLRECSS